MSAKTHYKKPGTEDALCCADGAMAGFGNAYYMTQTTVAKHVTCKRCLNKLGLAPALREGSTVCAYCRFPLSKCLCQQHD